MQLEVEVKGLYYTVLFVEDLRMSIFYDGGEALRDAYERVRMDSDEEAQW